MPLQFNPPDWIVQEYLNRKTPAQEATQGIQQALQNYLALDQSKRQNTLAQQQIDLATRANKLKEFEAAATYSDLDKIPELAKQYGLDIPISQPTQIQQGPPSMNGFPMTSTEMESQQSIPTEHPIGPVLNFRKSNQSTQPPSGFPLQAPTSKAGIERFKAQLAVSPKQMISKDQLDKQGGMLQPWQELESRAGRNIVTATSKRTGMQYLVDKDDPNNPIPLKFPGEKGLVWTPEQVDYIDRSQKDFAKDKIVVDARDARSRMDHLLTVLHSNNAAAPGPFGSLMARTVATEGGRLTEDDVQRNTGSRALTDKFARLMKRATVGKFTETDKADFNDLILKIDQAMNRKLQAVTMERATNYSRLASRMGPPISVEEVIETIGLPTNIRSPFQEPEFQSQFPKYDTGQGNGQTGGGLTPDKKARLEELRRKRAEGTLR